MFLPRYGVRRQLSGILDPSSGTASSASESSSSATPVSTSSPSSTTPPADSSTTPSSSTTPTSAPVSSTTPVSSSTTPTSSSSSTLPSSASSSSVAKSSTVTQIITPTTVIVVGTSTITTTGPVQTSVSVGSGSSSNASNGGSNLSSGARSGIIAGSVVGGVAVIALILVGCLAMRRRRRNRLDAQNNILWPEIAANPEDRAALYPEQTHATGRAGIGGDDMEEVAALGAGNAGVGAARWNSQSTGGREPTLPTIPPSIYSEENSNGHYSSPSPYSGNSYQNYSGAGSSNQSHQPLAPGPASIDYHRQTPSPPRQNYPTTATSSNGHTDVGGALPLPGSEMDHEEIARPLSPTPMQVGGAFGPGYDETDGGRGWRLSVVNDDAREDRL